MDHPPRRAGEGVEAEIENLQEVEGISGEDRLRDEDSPMSVMGIIVGGSISVNINVHIGSSYIEYGISYQR